MADLSSVTIEATVETNAEVEVEITSSPEINIEVIGSGPAGPPGIQGPQGPEGSPGAAATIAVGTVTTGDPGDPVSVTNSGTSSAAVLNFTIPKGDTGADGATGDSGVYYGTTTPTDPDIKVWIDPSGTQDVGFVPSGGTTGQMLQKKSSTDYDTEWATVTIPTKVSDLTNDSGFITSYTETDPVFSASAASGISSSDISSWNGKSDFSGSYTDLTNKPTIPTKTSDLDNDSGFLTTAVTSFNGNTGAVTYTAPVTSVNGNTGAVTISVPSASSATPQALGTAAAGSSGDFSRADHVHAKPTYSKSDVGLGNVDNVKQYSASNPPPYPVTSVNGSTGSVSLSIPATASDVGAIALPASPSSGDFLVYNGSAWAAVTMAEWQGGNY